MREIKFRAWDKRNKAWIYSTHIDGSQAWFWDMVEEYDCDLMQFTGLHDKNGKEIWEGDVLEYFTYMTPKGTNPRRIQTVTWNEWHWEGIRNWKQSEVVGNIYESNIEELKCQKE